MKDKQLTLAALALLEREKAVSIPQLATMLNASEDEVFDALETLVFAYDAASLRLDLRETYATLETYGKDRLLRLTAPETDALVDALTAAGFTDDDELVQSLIRTKSVLGTDDAGARLRVIADKPQVSVSEIAAAACEDVGHHLLEISYQGTDDDAPLSRCIEPLRIASKDGHRYLQAYCLEADGWRSFRLDRILDAKLLDETFVPRDVVPRTLVAIDSGCAQARIAFSAGCPVPNWQGLKTSKMAEGDDYVGTIPWTGSSWLPKHVVSLMGEAVPLQPEALISACDEYARSLLRSADMQERSND